MKHIPILFSTEMVQSILEGRKKMTRRTKGLEQFNNPEDRPHDELWEENPGRWFYAGLKDGIIHMECMDTFESFETKVPYSIGDILWVRESFYKPINDIFEGKYFYKADLEGHTWSFKWRPSIHMPKAACRIFLRVTDVRCERLQDVSEQDAIDEGITRIISIFNEFRYEDYLDPEITWKDPKSSFKSLWVKINGQQSWDDNPWVWVVSFERCEMPDDFLTTK